MAEPFFTEVTGPIPFGGLDSTDPLAFKVYDPDRLVLGKRMEDHLRHRRLLLALVRLARRGHVRRRARSTGRGSIRPATRWTPPGTKMAVAFEFFDEARRALLLLPRPRRRARGRALRRLPGATSTRSPTTPPATRSGPASRLLWGTANLFTHPRYQAGAATNPDPEVFAYAAAQVKHMLEVTQRLGGAELRPVGRPRGLRHAAQHGPARARAPSSPASSTSSPSTSTRSGSRASC